MTTGKLNHMLIDACVEGTKWKVSRNACYTIDKVTLKPHCRVLYHFLKNHLILSTHNSTILKERLLLFHSIMMGRKINVGNIIFWEVHHCALKTDDALNFPLLIIAHCQKVKVPLQVKKERTPHKGVITKHITLKFYGEELPRHSNPSSASSLPWPADAAPSTSKTTFE
ncbi:hypothetical protein J1N35_018620 [Gossypium stocksii]|uniref:Putative plant transposon protein domain-containing protein n=1 Tax=Gossypium stocksii TaxID=47602 RepID=A0A9D3VR18_9ROSI|nr:hypothetical protein J1N35_018620 [Gossypium stocksii]